jgi:hypothetical protein
VFYPDCLAPKLVLWCDFGYKQARYRLWHYNTKDQRKWRLLLDFTVN